MSEQMTLNISGMKCGGCVSAVEDALKAVSGVDAVEVDLAANKAVVSGSAETSELIAAVEAAGYKAE